MLLKRQTSERNELSFSLVLILRNKESLTIYYTVIKYILIIDSTLVSMLVD